ncbi:hypothetical protein N7492_010207 [Penicillium capsulatum]|uniref:Uncharacterized protein n=1 Tax=Penicillium capsulatum TaxID=69766 RepID=A0A9W9LF21_9EURO|nr:hypothetical protein N7492_010207 [Penicillium capsulatum]KAJ6112715.1 hypothetical protein N7512_008039 [Penicillium capsulatum]
MHPCIFTRQSHGEGVGTGVSGDRRDNHATLIRKNVEKGEHWKDAYETPPRKPYLDPCAWKMSCSDVELGGDHGPCDDDVLGNSTHDVVRDQKAPAQR